VDINSHWNLHNLNFCCLYFQYPAFYQTTTNFSTKRARSSINIFITVATMDIITSTHLADIMVTILSTALVNCTVFIMAAAQACTLVTTLATTQVIKATT
jgi:hypothetical protein